MFGLNAFEELITSQSAIRAQFVAMALEKNRRATPFVAQARALKSAIQPLARPNLLLEKPDLQAALLVAAGVSDKALKHLDTYDKQEAIQGLIVNFLEPVGDAWQEEVIYRFLLTRGDTLGGEMRNVAGVLGSRRLTRALIAALELGQTSYSWHHEQLKQWGVGTSQSVDVEIWANGLCWQSNIGNRILLYNRSVPWSVKM